MYIEISNAGYSNPHCTLKFRSVDSRDLWKTKLCGKYTSLIDNFSSLVFGLYL